MEDEQLFDHQYKTKLINLNSLYNFVPVGFYAYLGHVLFITERILLTLSMELRGMTELRKRKPLVVCTPFWEYTIVVRLRQLFPTASYLHCLYGSG